MQHNGEFSGTWDNGREKLNIHIPIVLFEEDGTQIAYCPALDVSGYGKSEREAVESFKTVLGEFLLYTVRKNTLHKVLQGLGWIIKKSKSKAMVPPSIEKLSETNVDLSRILAMPHSISEQSFAIPS